MADDEAALESQDGGEEQEPQSAPILSLKVILVIVGVVLVEALFFGIIFYIQSGDKEEEEETSTMVKDDIEFFKQYTVNFESLNYSVRTAGGSRTTMITMDMEIVIGRTDEEIRKETEVLPADLEKFKIAVQRMEGGLRDRLNDAVAGMNQSHLLSTEGKDQIKRMVREYLTKQLEGVNLKLSSADLTKDRIKEVNITKFLVVQ